MAGSLFSEWKQVWNNNAHRSVEFLTLSVNTQLGAVGQETSMIDIPNLGNPIFGIRMRLQGNMTTDANTVRLATNIIGRAFDVRIYKPDGKPLIYLGANGGVRVHTIAPGVNDTISPGDICMYSELFLERQLAKMDRASGRLGPQTGNGNVYVDILIPCYIPADAGTHRLQLRNSSFTWAAGTGTIYAANPANVPAVSTWTLELIEECLPMGATMTYFGVTNPQTIQANVGDNYWGQYLNRGQMIKAILLQSALPANTDDLRLTHEGNQIVDTEFEDQVALTTALFNCDFNMVGGSNYGLEEFGAGAAIIHAPHRNVAIIMPGDLIVSDSTQLHYECNTALQNVRVMQFQVMELPRAATRPEILSTQPAKSTPVVAVTESTAGSPQVNQGAGILGNLLTF